MSLTSYRAAPPRDPCRSNDACFFLRRKRIKIYNNKGDAVRQKSVLPERARKTLRLRQKSCYPDSLKTKEAERTF